MDPVLLLLDATGVDTSNLNGILFPRSAGNFIYHQKAGWLAHLLDSSCIKFAHRKWSAEKKLRYAYDFDAPSW